MIYFISDTHFYHGNIIRYASRPFKSVEEMNEVLIENWNDIVKPTDKVYHLGDVGLCSKELLEGMLSRLNGKIYLVRGNHDQRGLSTWEEFGITILRNPPIKLEEEKFLLSHVPQNDNIIPEGFINIHGHIHDKKLNGCYYHNEEKLIEYPEERYNQSVHFNVSVENIGYKPISIYEIRKRISKGEYYLN